MQPVEAVCWGHLLRAQSEAEERMELEGQKSDDQHAAPLLSSTLWGILKIAPPQSGLYGL